MNVLIVKLGAAGDVVRTTTLLHRFAGHVSWITEPKNALLLQGLKENLRCLAWNDRDVVRDRAYDLVINLEDTKPVGEFLNTVKSRQLFGAFLDSNNVLRYSDDSRPWFDLSLISTYGPQKADQLKLQNRRTYQDLIFAGLGFSFTGDPYFLPKPIETTLNGDVAIAPEAGTVWPMKNWSYYDVLSTKLRNQGLKVNILPKRPSLLEHLSDVQNHRCLVGGDSLPMHLALGTGTRCVTIFTCTSPWEIHGYGLQRQLISPRLAEFFYKRGYDDRATTAISLDEVFDAVMSQLGSESLTAR